VVAMSTYAFDGLSPSWPIAHSVKITSPIKGQQVPIGNPVISGTSKDNINSNCYVNVIVNERKSYQLSL
jgi:hypothetical protein